VLEHEGGNVRAALEWALASGELDLGVRLAVGLEGFWVARNPFEGMRWFSLLLAHEGELAPELRARAFRAWGGATFIVGRYEEGARLYEKSLSLYRRLGDERGVGELLHRLAIFEFQRDDTVRARALAEEAGELLRRAGFLKGELETVATLGDIEFAEGNHDRGLELMRKSIELADEVGFTWWKVASTMILAYNLIKLGRLDEAEKCMREVLPQTRAIGERQFLLFGLAQLAWIAAKTGRTERAGILWGAVETEESRGPVGQWENERAEYEAAVLAVAGPDFERGRVAGRALTLDEAVKYALTSS
jgi:tetratricopeptide (TPR) repeat protein